MGEPTVLCRAVPVLDICRDIDDSTGSELDCVLTFLLIPTSAADADQHLTDARERALAEYMQTLDVKKYHSRNNFIIEALAEYVDLQSISREQHEDDIRNIIREEMRACFAKANFAPQPMASVSALTAEQQEEANQDILDDLKLFD